jgi:hypothetical protein
VLLSVYGLLETPNEQSPLFQMAGDILASNPALFAKYVREWAQNGAALNGEQVKSLHEMGYSTRRIVGALVETCGDLEQAVDLMQNERWQPRVLVKAGSGEGVAQAEAVGWAAAPGIDASMRNRDAQLHQQRAVGQGFIQQQQQQLLQHQQHGRSAKVRACVLSCGWSWGLRAMQGATKRLVCLCVCVCDICTRSQMRACSHYTTFASSLLLTIKCCRMVGESTRTRRAAGCIIIINSRKQHSGSDQLRLTCKPTACRPEVLVFTQGWDAQWRVH